MNAYNRDVFLREALPMPLTNVDQSHFEWSKWPHKAWLLSQARARMKPEERGAFADLKDIAATQVPFGSIPNDDAVIAGWLGVSETKWVKMRAHVLHSDVWTLCDDNRYYLPMLIDQLANAPTTAARNDDVNKPAGKEKKAIDPALSAKRSDAAKQRHANRVKQSANDDANSLQNSAKHANGSANDANLQDANLQNSANLHANEGGKGGDLDLDSELDLDKDSKKQTHAANQANAELMQNAEIVFLFWKKTFSMSEKTIFGGKRKTNVIARLKDGYSVTQLQTAITGCSKSDFHTKNHHTDLELICRDITHTDKFIAMASTATAGSVNAQYQDQINNSVPVTPEDLENDPDWILYQQMNGGNHANNR